MGLHMIQMSVLESMKVKTHSGDTEKTAFLKMSPSLPQLLTDWAWHAPRRQKIAITSFSFIMVFGALRECNRHKFMADLGIG